MKTLRQILALAGMAAALCLTATRTHAQERPPGRGNFDPEQMRERMMEGLRQRLEVTNDDEWKIVQERIVKVNEARREVGFGGMGMMGRGMAPRGQRGGGGGGGNGGGAAATAGAGGAENAGNSAEAQRPNRGGGGGAFGGGSLPEGDELQKAIDAKASPDEIKAKLSKYREARKAKQANLTKAQDELRKVLSVRQEAVAVMNGLLD